MVIDVLYERHGVRAQTRRLIGCACLDKFTTVEDMFVLLRNAFDRTQVLFPHICPSCPIPKHISFLAITNNSQLPL